MFGVIVLKSTNPTQPISFDEKATLEPNELKAEVSEEILKWHSHSHSLSAEL